MMPLDLDLQANLSVTAYSPLFLDPDDAELLSRQAWRVRLGVLEPEPPAPERLVRRAASPDRDAGAIVYDWEAAHDPDRDRDYGYDCVCDWTWLFSPPCLTEAWAARLGVVLPVGA
jgi:hypothetical protein